MRSLLRDARHRSSSRRLTLRSARPAICDTVCDGSDGRAPRGRAADGAGRRDRGRRRARRRCGGDEGARAAARRRRRTREAWRLNGTAWRGGRREDGSRRPRRPPRHRVEVVNDDDDDEGAVPLPARRTDVSERRPDVAADREDGPHARELGGRGRGGRPHDRRRRRPAR